MLVKGHVENYLDLQVYKEDLKRGLDLSVYEDLTRDLELQVYKEDLTRGLDLNADNSGPGQRALEGDLDLCTGKSDL